MKALRYAALSGSIAFAVAAQAQAQQATQFTAFLAGTQEVPAIFTAGSAMFTMTVVNNDTQINFQLTYANLTAAPTAAHVHFGQRGVSGGVSFFLCGGGGKPACPTTPSGTVTGSVVAAGGVVGPADQGIAAGNLAAILQMIRAGLGYANMHTPLHPNGEIRGQLLLAGD
jgi:hypothetical protein